MSGFGKISSIISLFLVGLCMLSSCKKETLNPDPTEVRDLWELTPSASIDLYADYPFQIQFANSDELMVIQRYGGSSFTNCYCLSENNEWKRFAVDSLNTNLNRTLLTRVSQENALWVLTDTRLVKVSSCGNFESYKVVDSDSLMFTDVNQRFVGLEIVDGTPWLLHAKWGLFHFDMISELLVHHPVLDPFPFYSELSDIGYYESLAQTNDGKLLFSNEDGRSWARLSSNNVQPIEIFSCGNCRYNNLKNNATGKVVANVTNSQGLVSTRTLPELLLEPSLPLFEEPEYFSESVFDNSGFLAYFSGHPNSQPFIGLQPNGLNVQIINAQHAVNQGNITVYDLAFNSQNELFAATDQGIIKYLGKDE